jgi:hypothetical protein
MIPGKKPLSILSFRMILLLLKGAMQSGIAIDNNRNKSSNIYGYPLDIM